MKYKLSILTLLFFVITVANCKPISKDVKIKDGQNNKESSIKQDTLNSDTSNNNEMIYALLEGVWAENEYDNAVFYIKNKNLYYVENQDTPIKITVSKNSFTIMGDIPVKCKLLKLNCDSLIYIDEFSDTPTKLYKRK